MNFLYMAFCVKIVNQLENVMQILFCDTYIFRNSFGNAIFCIMHGILKCFIFSFSVVVTVDNQPIRLQLCDTAGQVSNSQMTRLA